MIRWTESIMLEQHVIIKFLPALVASIHGYLLPDTNQNCFVPARLYTG